VAIVDEEIQLVILDDVIGQHVERDVHVSIVLGFHGCSKVKFLQITHHALGSWH